MNLKQALKRKNRLVGLIAEEYIKVSQYNSVDDVNQRPYSVKEALQNWLKLTDELIELKSKIQTANNKVNDKIFRLAELKTQVKQLKKLDCTSGLYYSKWSDDKVVTKVAEIEVIERDKMVKEMEAQIEKIQDELDEWNHQTILP
jgi:DNA repair exonuclease SbcCD ATPase subunit